MTILQQRIHIKAIIKNLKLLKSLIAMEKCGWESIFEEKKEGTKQAVLYTSRRYDPIVEIGNLFGHTSTALLASSKQTSVPLITLGNFVWNPFCLSLEVQRSDEQGDHIINYSFKRQS